MSKSKVLSSRANFDEIIDYLRERFEVETNQEDVVFTCEQLREKLSDKEGALLSAVDRIDADLLDACPRLKVVCVVAVGYNNLDIAACTARGVLATNTPDVLNDTTADMAWALMLAAARRITEAERWLRACHWKGWKNDQFLSADVHHATLGIVGMGRIGQAVARRARGFEMRVLYHNRTRIAAEVEQALGASFVSLEQLLGEADFVSIHVPYSPESHHLIGERQISLMKPNAFLINTARGGIVDDAALVAALKDRRIAGAGLDVYEGEPKLHSGFLELENVALAPHIGSASRATRMRMGMLAAQNLEIALQGGVPPSVLNPEALRNRRT